MKKNYLSVLLFPFLLPVIQGCYNKPKKAVVQPLPKSNYIFTDVKELEALPVIDQNASGTCWSFSTSSFLESEIIRLKGEKIDLSEMYFVRCAYMLKARNYILRQGTARFTEGGLNHDPLISSVTFGLLPQSAYTGLKDGKARHNHFKLFNELDTAVKRCANPANKQGTGWKTQVPDILDRFLGKVPDQFQYNGQMYTPFSFLAYTQLNTADYLTITSFTDAPFYQRFQLSIPANWANERFYNLPLDEFMENIDHAVDAGVSLALDLDATEPTFSPDQGIAVLPEKQEDNTLILTDVRPEKKVTQQMRQDAFESFETTDDHLMHIVGKAKDQYGNSYYKAKNSWGTNALRRGFIYLSIPYMRMKGISVLLHKDGLMDTTKHKLLNAPT